MARVPRLARTRGGAAGLVILVLVLGIALFGAARAPHAIDVPIGPPGSTPSREAPLGTDFLGRDVLSRTLAGGLSVIWIAGVATALSYLAGVTVGLIAGYRRGRLDPVLMRTVDVLFAFPALLVLLVLVSGLGNRVWVLIVGIVLIQLPGIARVMRTATLETSTRGYVEAAVARGERTPSILLREILPNISPIVLADAGVRFSYSIILLASVNYLGLGLSPPAADWGLMVSENKQYIALNAWSVLAPAIMLALLTISVNLAADAYIRTRRYSGTPSASLRRRRGRAVPLVKNRTTSHAG